MRSTVILGLMIISCLCSCKKASFSGATNPIKDDKKAEAPEETQPKDGSGNDANKEPPKTDPNPPPVVEVEPTPKPKPAPVKGVTGGGGSNSEGNTDGGDDSEGDNNTGGGSSSSGGSSANK